MMLTFCSGTGLSKKIAKRQAATNLLNILENLSPDGKKALLNRPQGQVHLIDDSLSIDKKDSLSRLE